MVIFVLDKQKKPLMPCCEKRARLLLKRKRAVVHRVAPFTIRLKDRQVKTSQKQFLRLKIDPGAIITGLALLREKFPNDRDAEEEKVVLIWAAEVHHKITVKDKLTKRRALRRSRRNRKCRYRAARFLNRKRKQNWLPPSLEARVDQTLHAVLKLHRSLPLTALGVEHVKFDTQLIQNPNIQGTEYQQGTLFGYEVKEYLLEKFQRQCAYCQGASGDKILEVDHVIPLQPQQGPTGTNRISNLVIACKMCNKAKGNLQPNDWLHQLETSGASLDQLRIQRLPLVIKQLKQPLKAVAFLNATRYRLYEHLRTLGLPVECGTGAGTKMQRLALGLPKSHIFDAACVGASTSSHLSVQIHYVCHWQALGRGTRQMARANKYGFPLAHRKRQKLVNGFQTGDLVTAEIPKGKYQGCWRGRVAVRASGYFDLKDHRGQRICQGISYQYCYLLQHADGWYYTQYSLPLLPGEKTLFSSN